MEQTKFHSNPNLLETNDFDISTIIQDQNPIKWNYDKLKQELQAIEDKNIIQWINRANYLINKLETNIFNGFYQLIDLDLSHNIITCLPKGVFDQLFNLQVVNLSHNLIYELEDSVFRNNKQLRTINLSNNLLNVINNHSFNYLPFLRILDYSYNIIEIISQMCINSECLRELNLSYNKIIILSNFSFHSLPNLIHLQLSNNRIWYLNKLLFQNSKNIENLNLSNNFIRKLDKNTFANLNNLKQVNFSNNLLTTFKTCFLNKPMLNELNLLNNQIRIISPKEISISNNIRTLKLTIVELQKLGKFVNLALLSDLEFHLKAPRIFPLKQFLTWINELIIQKLYLVIQRGVFNISHEISNLINLEFLHIEFLEPNKHKTIFYIWSYINTSKLKHLALININKLLVISNMNSIWHTLTYLDLSGIYNSSVDFLINKVIMLEYLNLSLSQVFYISQGLLKTLPNLKYLIMNGTKISVIEDNLFKYNSKLEVISFKDCQIKVIGENSFRHLENLKQIDIRGNTEVRVTQSLLSGIPKSAIFYSTN